MVRKFPYDDFAMDHLSKQHRSTPIWIAHRGDIQRCPENTLAALRSAFDCGADWVEFDVQLSRDGVPFLLHDQDLLRTAGIQADALEFEWGQLSKIRVSESGRLTNAFPHETIPALQDVVALLEQQPGKCAFVELKRASLRRFGIEEVVSRVVETLLPVLSRCVLISFDWPAVQAARRQGAHSIGWVLSEWSVEACTEAETLAPEFLFCNYQRMPDQAVLWDGPWQWVIYDVMNVECARSLISRGVRYLETGAICEFVNNPVFQKGAGIGG